MRQLLALALLASSPALAADEPANLTDQHKADIMQYVGDRLLDSESARWRWVPDQPGYGAYCGWVNAKNSYGAYTGWEPYMIIGGPGSTGRYSVSHVELAKGAINAEVIQRTCESRGYDMSGPPPE